MTVGLTGNIATGKSTVYQELLSYERVRGFDADAVVHALYEEEAVISEIVEAFGREVLNDQKLPCRGKLRELFLRKPTARRTLEEIFHPRVREKYQESVTFLPPRMHLVADIPLLFENEVTYDFDFVIVVACSEVMQLERLLERSKLDPLDAQKMINKQVALKDKIVKADYVLWNEGSFSQLQSQIKTLVHHLF